MHHSRIRPVSRFLALFVVLFVSTKAFAQDPPKVDAKVEAASKNLQKKAMQDYVAIDFAKAREKLDKAIADCGADKCAAATRAQLHRDLGVVLVGGKLDRDKGVAAFAEAQKLDPKLELDPDLKTKDLETAWETAKKGGSTAPPAPNPNSKTPTGDFKHTPIPEQRYRTPVPVYAEYGGEEAVVRAIVRYKGFGMNEFKPIELKKMGEKGWGALIPCGDVQVGTMQYYIQGFNAENDPIAVAGDRKNTFQVPIKREKLTAGEAPHLPGEPPPAACADTGDCPPDFPGCKPVSGANATSEDVPLKGEGSECEANSECKSGTCKKDDPEKSGTCTAEGGQLKRIWVGVFGSVDFAIIPSADNVCKLHPKDASDTDQSMWNVPINDKGYYCIDGDKDYPMRFTNVAEQAENNAIVVDKSSKVKSGTAVGNIRLYASIDYAANANVMVGLRAGVALHGYPGTEAQKDRDKGTGRSAFNPLHLEARGTYVFGKDALTKPGLAPYGFFALGLSTFEAKVSVNVAEQGKSQTKSVDAWSLTGPFFTTIGGGARYALSNRAALMGALRLNFAFGNAFVPAIAPELGAQFGF